MKEENKKSKKKVLLYYLILAACLLVIAAVTVTLVFTVGKNNSSDLTLDNDQHQPDNDNSGGNTGDDGNNGDNTGDDDNNGDNTGDDDNNGDTPTTTPTGYILPVDTANVTVSFEFGYDNTLDRYCVHRGMDFDCEAGDSVKAVLDGTVTKIVSDSFIGENYITINHGNGITATYKYIVVDENLTEGSAVSRGDVIGTVAEAAGMEMKQGEHLHFEISVNGKLTDPNDYLDIIQK